MRRLYPSFILLALCCSVCFVQAQPSGEVLDEIYLRFESAKQAAPLSLVTAIKEMEVGMELADRTGFEPVMSQGRMLFGDIYREYQQHPDHLRLAVNYYLDAARLCGSNLSCLARAQYYAGQGFMEFEDYEQATRYLLLSRALYERIPDTAMQVYALLSLSETSQATETWEEVKGYANEALALARAANMDSARTMSLLHIAAQNVYNKDYPEATALLAEAIQLAEEAPYPSILGEAKLKQANLMFLTNNPTLSIGYYNEAMALFEKHENLEGKVRALLGIGSIQIDQKAFDEAEKVVERVIGLAQIHQLIPELHQGYELLASIALEKRQISRYLSLEKRANSIRDTLYLRSEQNLIRRLTAQFDAVRKADKIKQLEQVGKLKEIELQQSRSQIQFAIVIGLLLVLLAIVLYQQYRTKRKLSERLEWTVERRTDQLRQANLDLKDVNEELDTFAYRTAHDIRGPVARLLGLCQVAMAEHGGGEVHRFMRLIHQEAIQMDFMLHRFLEVNSIKHLPRKVEPVNLAHSLDSVIEKASHLDALKEIQVVKRIAPNVEIVSDPDLVSIILKNLIENAIIFSQRAEDMASYIEIEGFQTGKFVEIRVKDNGIGIDSEVAPRIFEMFFRGTTVSKGLGLGLYATQIATHELKGRIWLNEDNEDQTEFVLRLPRSLDLTSPVETGIK